MADICVVGVVVRLAAIGKEGLLWQETSWLGRNTLDRLRRQRYYVSV